MTTDWGHCGCALSADVCQAPLALGQGPFKVSGSLTPDPSASWLALSRGLLAMRPAGHGHGPLSPAHLCDCQEQIPVSSDGDVLTKWGHRAPGPSGHQWDVGGPRSAPSQSHPPPRKLPDRSAGPVAAGAVKTPSPEPQATGAIALPSNSGAWPRRGLRGLFLFGLLESTDGFLGHCLPEPQRDVVTRGAS